MSGSPTPSSELQFKLVRIVKEFLVHSGLHMTVDTLDREAEIRLLQPQSVVNPGSSIIGNSGSNSVREKAARIESILRCFDNGDRDSFFRAWDAVLPAVVRRSDPTGHRLEFYLEIFFSIYPILTHRPELFPDAVQKFRRFIETKGHSLAQTAEFLPFYALPYVPDPQKHPSFQVLFRDDWAQDLRLRVERFLGLILSTKTPKLYAMYEAYDNNNNNNNNNNNKISSDGNNSGNGNDSSVDVRRLRDRISRMESHHTAVRHHLMNRHESLQEAFKDLLATATHLQFALKSAMTSGEHPPDDFLPEVKKQLAGYIAGGHLAEIEPPSSNRNGSRNSSSNDPHHSRGSRPGSASSNNNGGDSNDIYNDGNNSNSYHNSVPQIGGIDRVSPGSNNSAGEEGAYASSSQHLMAAEGSLPPPIPTPRLLAPLSYDLVKSDLAGNDHMQRTVLLQALRWRLTRSRKGKTRRAALDAYIQSDLLNISDGDDSLLVSLTTGAPHSARGEGGVVASHAGGPESGGFVREYAARLVFTISLECRGRSYLLGYDGLIPLLVAMLFEESTDNPAQQSTLGVLQKLSLRRAPQTAMIRLGMIGWLCGLLANADALSEYSTEYGAALLMNLVLREEGKRECERLILEDASANNNSSSSSSTSSRSSRSKKDADDPKKNILEVLNDLLEHESIQVRNYVNGALYSVLSRSAVRERARAMGMEEILQSLMMMSTHSLQHQLEYILDQLRSEAEDDDDSSDDEDEDDEDDEDDDDDDDDNEGGNNDDDGVIADDEEETLTAALVHGASGERFLCERYLASDSAAREQYERDSRAAAAQYSTRRPSSKQSVRFKDGSDPSKPMDRPSTPRTSVQPGVYNSGNNSSNNSNNNSNNGDDNHAGMNSTTGQAPPNSGRPPRAQRPSSAQRKQQQQQQQQQPARNDAMLGSTTDPLVSRPKIPRTPVGGEDAPRGGTFPIQSRPLSSQDGVYDTPSSNNNDDHVVSTGHNGNENANPPNETKKEGRKTPPPPLPPADDDNPFATRPKLPRTPSLTNM